MRRKRETWNYRDPRVKEMILDKETKSREMHEQGDEGKKANNKEHSDRILQFRLRSILLWKMRVKGVRLCERGRGLHAVSWFCEWRQLYFIWTTRVQNKEERKRKGERRKEKCMDCSSGTSTVVLTDTTRILSEASPSLLIWPERPL